MRILLVNQFFWPDSAATSQLLTDLARALADLQHEVHVVCGSSGYTDKDLSPEPNVTIRRSPTFPFRRSKPARLLSYFSFFSTAALIGLTAKRFDLVITLTTPPLLSVMGTLLKRLRGTRHFIWEMDVYPEIAVDLGMLSSDGMLTNLIGSIADISRNSSDGVVVLGPCMRDRLVQRGIDAAKIHIAENWADGHAIEPLPLRNRPELRVLYSGNLGLAHDVDTISDAMHILKDDARVLFIFAGGGALREDLQKKCEAAGLSHVEFRPYCKRELLGQSLGDGDLGLVTQKSTCTGSVVPSKIYGLMAAGRPLLYIGPRDTTPARIIEKYRCGWQVDPGDSGGLVTLLQLLHDDPEMVRDAGRRGRQALLENYDLPLGVARVCSIVGALEQDDAAAFAEQPEIEPTTSAFTA